jgi:hypothetical protein
MVSEPVQIILPLESGEAGRGKKPFLFFAFLF